MDTGFYKWVWRFNAVAIALVTLLALGLIGTQVVSSLSRAFFPTQTTNTLAVTPSATTPTTDRPEDRTTKRYFSSPLSTNTQGVYPLPLYIEQRYENRGSYKSSDGNLVNFRIVESEPASNRWLFDKGERLIQNTTQLTLRQSGIEDIQLGHLLAIVETDTNGDERLSARDMQTLYVTGPLWSTPVKIAQDVLSVLSTTPVSPTTLDLIYNSPRGTHIARLDVRSGELLAEQVVTTQD